MKKVTVFTLLCCILLCFVSCEESTYNDLFPNEDCVMVFTISDTEQIKILNQENSDFNFYGEWITGGNPTPVYIFVDYTHGTNGYAGADVILRYFYPDEKDHVITKGEKSFRFEKDVQNSSYLLNFDTKEKIAITYSTESIDSYQPSWISDILLSFKDVKEKIYQEEKLNFWYDFENQVGEWTTNEATVPIKMKFVGVTPKNVHLTVIDTNTGKEILTASGELTDENTFVSDEVFGTMFYENTVSDITITRTDKASQ